MPDEPGAEETSFLDLPEDVLRAHIVPAKGLLYSLEDIRSLAQTCTALRALCDDALLWKDVVQRRFGPFHGTGAHAGWTTIHGLRSPGGDVAPPAGTPPERIGQVAAATEGIVAYTQAGMKSSLRPPIEWEFDEGACMHVRNAPPTAAGMSTEGPPPSLLPPSFPGWVLFMGVDGSCPGPTRSSEQPIGVRTLGQLEAFARAHGMQAFTLGGVALKTVHHCSHWTANRRAWSGLYVRADVAASVAPPPVQQHGSIDWRLVAHILAKTRLSAMTDMGVTWLNGNYLARESMGGSVCPEVVKLRSVCWLELSGRWAGVGPGRWAVVARMWLGNEPYGMHWNLHATAKLNAVSAAADGSGGAEGPMAGAAPEEAGSTLWERTLELHRLKELHGETRWFETELGTFEVPPGCAYTISVRMGNTNGNWKSGVAWDYMELRRVDPAPQGTGAAGTSAAGASGSEPEPGSSGAAGAIRRVTRSMTGALWRLLPRS